MDPYCFVITSFGVKDDLADLKAKHSAGKKEAPRKIDFDRICKELIEPAIRKASLEPLIESEEKTSGVIHKTMYEKILLCEFCIADLTNANPNAYYELGMRYAVKPHTTIPVIASAHLPLPFDVLNNRTYIYQVDDDFNLKERDKDIEGLAQRLIDAKKKRSTDSPLYDMINGISFQNSVAHEKTDVFRDKVIYDNTIKTELEYARAVTGDKDTVKNNRIHAIGAVVEKYSPLENMETAVLIDVMISYRNIDAFPEMLGFIRQLPTYVFETVMVQEQYAFVLNRIGGRAKPVDEVMIAMAEKVLQNLENNGKASSESYGIWGRIHKDRFDRAYGAGRLGEAKVHLGKALEYYEKGFRSDPRDSYPGVNYVTCLELLGKRDEALRLLPAVEYAVKAKMSRKQPDYWDYATLLELAVIESRYEAAEAFYYNAKTVVNESWMFGTTLNNLSKIINYRKERGEDITGATRIAALLRG